MTTSRNTVRLSRILVYPIKGFDPLERPQARLLPGGGLEHDRRWALVDDQGTFVSGKRDPRIHLLRSQYDERVSRLFLRLPTESDEREFTLAADQPRLAEILTRFFGYTIRLVENAETGFPDDSQASGPTLIGEATLEAVAGLFDGVDAAEMRRRLRTNLELSASEPFWEDRLVPSDPQRPVSFRIGNARLLGIHPCQRCVVPTRDSRTGVAAPGFQLRVAKGREASLPAWAPRERFNHFYRLAVNTRLASGHDQPWIRVGDPVEIRDAPPSRRREFPWGPASG